MSLKNLAALARSKDYTPTAETISMHGLGFIQIKLMGNQRLHVWHPHLPRRKCFEHSAIHNHRFSFNSVVLKGVQKNVRADLVLHPEGTHTIISHDGPRSEKGGRLSFPVGTCNVIEREEESYAPGCAYHMPALEYHHTPNSGIVITLLTKLVEGNIHANSVIRRPHDFDQDFDRFQLTPQELWEIVAHAIEF